jgi:hypothetical protein
MQVPQKRGMYNMDRRDRIMNCNASTTTIGLHALDPQGELASVMNSIHHVAVLSTSTVADAAGVESARCR